MIRNEKMLMTDFVFYEKYLRQNFYCTSMFYQFLQRFPLRNCMQIFRKEK